MGLIPWYTYRGVPGFTLRKLEMGGKGGEGVGGLHRGLLREVMVAWQGAAGDRGRALPPYVEHVGVQGTPSTPGRPSATRSRSSAAAVL
jgi:hypothetical protein